MRVLLVLPRLTDRGDSTSIYFRRLADGLEEHGCSIGVVHGVPPGWGRTHVPEGWWDGGFSAPRRGDVPPWARPLVRLASFFTPYKGGVLHRRQALAAVRRGVEEFLPDLLLCHDFPVLMDAVARLAPEKTCIWLVEPSPLHVGRGLLRRLRDAPHIGWWRQRARAVAWRAANVSGPPLAALERGLGRRVLTLFPGVPQALAPTEVLARIGFFGNLGARMRAWLAPRLGTLAEAAAGSGLTFHFRGLRASDRNWLRERLPGASVPVGRVSHHEVLAEMAACRLLLGIGVTSVQGTGKVLDYLGAARPVLYFGDLEGQDARLLARHEAGASFGWETPAAAMGACLEAALAVEPGPPPAALASGKQAENLLAWVGLLPGPLP